MENTMWIYEHGGIKEKAMFNIDIWCLESPDKGESNSKMESSRESEAHALEETGQADAELVETFLRNSTANIYTFVCIN